MEIKIEDCSTKIPQHHAIKKKMIWLNVIASALFSKTLHKII